jgi:hypothetical protein
VILFGCWSSRAAEVWRSICFMAFVWMRRLTCRAIIASKRTRFDRSSSTPCCPPRVRPLPHQSRARQELFYQAIVFADEWIDKRDVLQHDRLENLRSAGAGLRGAAPTPTTARPKMLGDGRGQRRDGCSKWRRGCGENPSCRLIAETHRSVGVSRSERSSTCGDATFRGWSAFIVLTSPL